MQVELITPQYQLYRLKLRLDKHPVYKKALKFNMTPMFLDYIRSRLIDFRQNVILSIFGETGTGKSFVGWKLAEHIEDLILEMLGVSVLFGSDNTHFDLASEIDLLKDAKWGQTHMTDEQTDFYGTNSSYVINTMRNIEMTVREKQVNFIYCAPCVRTHYHNYVLETFMVEWPKQRCTVLDPQYIPFGRTYCWVYSPESEKYLNPLGFIVVTHPKKLEELKKYTIKKREYIDRVLSGESISFEDMRMKHIQLFMDHPGSDNAIQKNEIIVILEKVLSGGIPKSYMKELATEIVMIREGKLELKKKKKFKKGSNNNIME